jgi:hypothetical protein
MPTGQATYPLSLLTDLVNAGGWDDVLERLKCFFFETFKRHVYLNELDLSSFPRKDIPHSAPLVYAQACMSSLMSKNARFSIHEDYSRSPLAASVKLFESGVKLWIVTVEMDNRESRNYENLLAVRSLL